MKKEAVYRDRCKRIADRNGYAMGMKELGHRANYRKHHKTIPIGFHIHHIDHVKTNNDINNLIAISPNLHSFVHAHHVKTGVKLTRSQIEGTYSNWKVRTAKEAFNRMKI